MEDAPTDDPAGGALDDEKQGLRDKVKGKMKDSLVSLATSSYDARADDLEERAVRAMRRAIEEEGERIRELLEHPDYELVGVAVNRLTSHGGDSRETINAIPAEDKPRTY